MVSFRVFLLAPLCAAAGLAACLAAAPAAAEDPTRGEGGPPRILVPAPEATEPYKVIPAPAPGTDGPPGGVYRRVTPPRDGEPAAQQYLPAAPNLPAAPSRPAEGRRDGDRDDDLERARAAARAARPDEPSNRSESARPSGSGCLSARDARDAIRSKRAVPLVTAARTARDAWSGEVIDYKLCNVQGLLTYDLTLLNSDGKVARARVDAGTGKLITVK